MSGLPLASAYFVEMLQAVVFALQGPSHLAPASAQTLLAASGSQMLEDNLVVCPRHSRHSDETLLCDHVTNLVHAAPFRHLYPRSAGKALSAVAFTTGCYKVTASSRLFQLSQLGSPSL